jgi:hypothetical protein
VRTVRAEFLFALASQCHAPPPVVDEMTVTDFVRLTQSLEDMSARGD